MITCREGRWVLYLQSWQGYSIKLKSYKIITHLCKCITRWHYWWHWRHAHRLIWWIRHPEKRKKKSFEWLHNNTNYMYMSHLPSSDKSATYREGCWREGCICKYELDRDMIVLDRMQHAVESELVSPSCLCLGIFILWHSKSLTIVKHTVFIKVNPKIR